MTPNTYHIEQGVHRPSTCEAASKAWKALDSLFIEIHGELADCDMTCVDDIDTASRLVTEIASVNIIMNTLLDACSEE